MSLDIPKRTGFAKNFKERHLKTRPVANITTCIGCAGCKNACPAKAINLFACVPDIELPPKTGEPRYRPEVKLSKCTRCYRCLEKCPQRAIMKFKPRIMKLIRL